MPGVLPGDILLVLQQKPHDVFKRNQDDLYMEKEITLVEALCGFKFHIPHLDERVLVVKSTNGQVITPGEVMKIEKEGMPRYRDPFEKGNLYLTFSIKFPTPQELTPQAVQALKKVLPKPEPLEENVENTEDVTLVHVRNQNETNGRAAEGEEEEEEDMDEEGQGPAVGCTQQ